MALIKGMLASFDDPLLGVVPTIVPFQYNPTEVTRVFRTEAARRRTAGADAGAALNAARPAPEDYTVKLELDATDGLERGGPLTTALGISPRLAALEMLMQPVGSSLLGGSSAAAGCSAAAARRSRRAKLPLVLFVWGPAAHHARCGSKSLTIHETAFDELLNPIHATADLGFTVLRDDDLADGRHVAQRGGRPTTRAPARSRPCCSSPQIAGAALRWPSRPHLALRRPADDRGPRSPTARCATLGAPRVVPRAAAARHVQGALPATGSTCSATPRPATRRAGGCSPTRTRGADATELEEPGQTIELPDA